MNEGNHTGLLSFVIINDKLRGQGYGTEMIRMALKNAYENTGAEAVRLCVFDVNTAAKKCYEKAGFAEHSIVPNALLFKGEQWGRCCMIAKPST